MPSRTQRALSPKRKNATRKTTTNKGNKTNLNKSIHNKSIRNKTYNKSDYNSNDGMLTAVWGPGMWHYLHTMSFNYPARPTCDDKRKYREFMLSLQYVLPCGKCLKNLTTNFQRLPLKWCNMKSRETFSKYVYDLHEIVNKMLNKSSGLTYAMVRERYEHFRARCAISIAKPDTQPIIPSEKGCTEPLYGEKSKCILKIVPEHVKCDTLEIDKQCIKRKLLTG